MVLKNLLKSIINNTIFQKEFRIGLRNKKVFIIQALFLLTLSTVAFFYMLSISDRGNYFQNNGRDFFKTICIVQWFLVVFVAPSFTTTAISSEKENKTFDMLMVSPLNASEILMGKLAYAVSYVFILLSSSLPIVTMVFFLGGVSPFEVLINYASLLLWGIFVCLIALYFSSRESRSSLATNHTYLLLILSLIFIFPFYLRLFWGSGLFIGYGTSIMGMLPWILVYLNIAWFFTFIYYKIKNNIRIEAGNILAMHVSFITIYVINILSLCSAAYNSLSSSYPSSLGNPSVFWSSFSMGNLFIMGCFIERQRFLSKKEEAKFDKSRTSKPFFFPLLFILSMIILGGVYFLADPAYIGKIAASIILFLVYLLFLILITSEVFTITAGKVRPVYVYFLTFISMNVIPLLFWLMNEGINMKSSAASSVFSLTFIHPVFSIISIWDPSADFGSVGILGAEIPTPLVSVAFYFLSYMFIKIAITYIVSIFPPKKAETKPAI